MLSKEQNIYCIYENKKAYPEYYVQFIIGEYKIIRMIKNHGLFTSLIKKLKELINTLI